MIRQELELNLDSDMKSFAEELKRCFSKNELESIARDTGFIKRKGKLFEYFTELFNYFEL